MLGVLQHPQAPTCLRPCRGYTIRWTELSKNKWLTDAMVLQYVVQLFFSCRYLICKTLVEQRSLSIHASRCGKYKWGETWKYHLNLSYSVPILSLLCLHAHDIWYRLGICWSDGSSVHLGEKPLHQKMHNVIINFADVHVHAYNKLFPALRVMCITSACMYTRRSYSVHSPDKHIHCKLQSPLTHAPNARVCNTQN